MQGTTLTVAIIGSILVLSLRPAYALAVYAAVLVWFPDYLRISIGTIDISVGRIVVTVLLLRCLCNDRVRQSFIWSRLDTWVTLSMAVYVGIYCATRPFLTALENRAGFLMDTWFTYMSARLIITDKATLTSFLKVVSVVLAALAILAVSESVGGRNYFLALKRFRVWDTPSGEGTGHARWGFQRAVGPFSHSIMLGSCFVMFLPLIWMLRHQRDYWGKLAFPLSGMVIFGALSSMSSGPWFMLMVAIFCLAMERHKPWARPLLIVLVLSCIGIQLIFQRSFYQVLIANANLAGGQGWQRVKLIDCAIRDFGEWCWLGYGERDPGWGLRRGLGYQTDLNNEFIAMGVRYGMLGIMALCMVIATAFRGLIRASKKSRDDELRSLYWSLGSALVSIIVIWQGVSFFGQPRMLFYCILGIIGASFGFTGCKDGR